MKNSSFSNFRPVVLILAVGSAWGSTALAERGQERISVFDTSLVKAGEGAAPERSRKGTAFGHFFKKIDLNHNGKISRSEARAASLKRFTALDADDDSIVTKQEVQAYLKERKTRNNKRSGTHQPTSFEKMDSNSDGSISRNETKMPAKFFAKFDSNSDEVISKSEFHAARVAMRANWTKHGLRLFENMDSNSDGRLTEAEATVAADKFFDKLDQNGDMSVTPVEARQISSVRLPGKGHTKP